MATTDLGGGWEELARQVLSEVKEWRIQHPRASLAEMEEELDRRWHRLRVRLLGDMALASEAAELQGAGQRLRCPQCGEALVSRGRRKRRLQTEGGQELVLERSYGVCPTCGVGFFPPR